MKYRLAVYSDNVLVYATEIGQNYKTKSITINSIFLVFEYR